MTRNVPGIEEGETSQQVWIRPKQFEQLIDSAHTPTEQHREDLDDVVTGWNHTNLRDDLLQQTMYDMGLRPEETVSLDWDDLRLDHDEPHVFLPAEKQKKPAQGRPRKAARMTFDLRDTERKFRMWKASAWKDTEAVFPGQGSDRISANRVWQIVTDLAEDAGVEPYLEDGTRGEPTDMHPHAYRHSIAYRYLVEEGKTIEDVKQRLRHRHLQTTEQYYEHFLMR